MFNATQDATKWPNKLVTIALFGVIVWYWLPHFMADDMPAKDAGVITIPMPVEEVVATKPIEPEEPAIEAPVEEVADAETLEPEEPAIEAPVEEVADAEIIETKEFAPKEPGRSEFSTTISGLSKDISQLATWIRQQGGAVWLDDGYLTLGKIYELTKDGRLKPVSKQHYKQATARYVSRMMSAFDHSKIRQSIRFDNSVKSKRLLLMWPQQVWQNIQTRASALNVERILIEYQTVNNQLHLQVVDAMRDGGPALDLIGPLP